VIDTTDINIQTADVLVSHKLDYFEVALGTHFFHMGSCQCFLEGGWNGKGIS